MSPNERGKSAYDDLMSAGRDYELEDILAEYGAGGPVPAAEKAVPVSDDAAPAAEPVFEEAEEILPEETVPEEALPKPPRPITLEDVVGSTVDAVMQAEAEELKLKKPRKGLFSRRRHEETEQLYDTLIPPAEEEPEEEEEEEPIGPEPELATEAEQYRLRLRRSTGTLVPAAILAVLPVAVALVEYLGYWIPYWSANYLMQSAVMLVCLAVQLSLCWPVLAKAVRMLRQKTCTAETLVILAALAAAGDCAVQMLTPQRAAVPVYAGVCLSGLAFALWGVRQADRAMYDTLRTAAMDEEPPYLVTETERGACKQRGTAHGFYTALAQDDISTAWQICLTPVILVAAIIFAGLSSLGQGRGADFLLNLSVILTAGATFAWPLCWALPFAGLAATLQKTGCALAGWHGACRISRRKAMIVTEEDLFPLTAVQLNGVKVFGEELQKADSYAASMSRAAGSGLEKLFDKRLRAEGGRYRDVVDFSFYTEGGYSGVIRGESVLMGTASFMRKMDVRLPGNINLKTGIFLAVDGDLIAVYAVKYLPADNVDYALKLMRRSHILPILAARDPNVTPALLKRKFSKNLRVEYPELVTRVALSEAEQDRGLPRALLFREGLLPYAEAVAGSGRLCLCVRRATLLAILGSLAGTLLSFYLVFVAAYSLLTPLALQAFLLLWTLPVLLVADRSGRY